MKVLYNSSLATFPMKEFSNNSLYNDNRLALCGLIGRI